MAGRGRADGGEGSLVALRSGLAPARRSPPCAPSSTPTAVLVSSGLVRPAGLSRAQRDGVRAGSAVAVLMSPKRGCRRTCWCAPLSRALLPHASANPPVALIYCKTEIFLSGLLHLAARNTLLLLRARPVATRAPPRWLSTVAVPAMLGAHSAVCSWYRCV